MLLEGRNLVVTGASRGIGAATARLAAVHGARVVVNYLSSREAAEQVVAEITTNGGTAYAVQADATKRDDVERLAAVASEKLGTIDSLVLNAAVQFRIAPLVGYAWDDFSAKLNGEMQAAFFGLQSFVPAMLEQGNGSIVAVSSGLSKHPGEGFCAHSTAKAGLNALMRSAAAELAPQGIRVNTVAPGLTDTDATAFMPAERKQMMASITPLRRIAKPEDIAGVIVAMLSDLSRFEAGAYVPVDGGMTML
ncbi:SDR family oxidoreductase [bacterium]|nr:SDR family oxidoreductase [bacterium]